jgi:hypothetical protein
MKTKWKKCPKKEPNEQRRKLLITRCSSLNWREKV